MSACVRTCVFIVALGTAGVAPGQAQTAVATPGPPRLEVDLGGLWLGGVSFGTADATLTGNQSAPSEYTLFTTASRLGTSGALEGRIGVRLTQTLSVEGAVLYARPTLETRVSGDVEGAPATTATERLSQIAIDVSGVVHLRRLRLGRAVPFLSGGAGYLRELHDSNVLVETGHTFHAGGGLKVPLVVRRGFIRTLGLRIDGRLYLRQGGADVDPDQPMRTFGAGGASLAIGF